MASNQKVEENRPILKFTTGTTGMPFEPCIHFVYYASVWYY